jgi:hypothetical protein
MLPKGRTLPWVSCDPMRDENRCVFGAALQGPEIQGICAVGLVGRSDPAALTLSVVVATACKMTVS